MASPSIEQLHLECVEALKALIGEAKRTCSLLESLSEFPTKPEIWHRAVEQRVRENDAHARYQDLRERLFDLIRPGHMRNG